MDHNILQRWKQDTRIRSIVWRDLLTLEKRDIFFELTLALPWLALEIFFISYGYYVLALIPAFFFFLTGLRQVHGGYHNSLGLTKSQTDWFLYVMSFLMLGSMHAVKYNHLQHHKHCLGEKDLEAKSAKMSAWGAIAFGPAFPILLHFKALKDGNAYYRRWIYAELAGNCVMIALAFYAPIVFVHVVLMAVGQCLTAFFAVWTVHHGCDDEIFARTQRGFLKNFVSYDMFYHVEHHLFPTVPQKNLAVLAKRLDKEVPELTTKRVF